MKIFSKVVFFVGLLMTIFGVQAQQDPLYSQYMFNPMILNPAYAGLHEMAMLTTTGRWQWTGIQGSPTTYAANFHTSLPVPKMGAGITVSKESYGITSNTEVQLALAYHLRFRENKLNFGVTGGFNNYSIDFANRGSDVNNANAHKLLIKSEDPNLQNVTFRKNAPNFGFGAIYTAKHFFAGVSIPKFIATEISSENKVTAIQFLRHYYITGGYVIKLVSGVVVKPSLLFRVVDKVQNTAGVEGTRVNIDMNISAYFKEKIWVGASFRKTDRKTLGSVVLMGQVQLNDYLKAGYSFDVPTDSQLRRAGRLATHEIMLNINFPLLDKQATQEILY